jgi:hypothetical protein
VQGKALKTPCKVTIFMVETQNGAKVQAVAGMKIRVTFHARRLPKARLAPRYKITQCHR